MPFIKLGLLYPPVVDGPAALAVTQSINSQILCCKEDSNKDSNQVDALAMWVHSSCVDLNKQQNGTLPVH